MSKYLTIHSDAPAGDGGVLAQATVADVIPKDMSVAVTDMLAETTEEYPMDTGGEVTIFRKPSHKEPDLAFSELSAGDLIYNRIWTTQHIDFALINEEMSNVISIWNAYIDRSVELTTINDPGESGLFLSTVTTPFSMTPNYEVTLTVTAYPSGPAVQETTYSFLVDGLTFETLVEGWRIIQWLVHPDWSQGVTIEYAFKTILSANPKRANEQRRPLYDKWLRAAEFQLWEKGRAAHRALNDVNAHAGKIFAVPIWPERCTTNSTIFQQTALVINEDLSTKINMLNTQYIIVIDPVLRLGEVKEVSNITGQVVTVGLSFKVNFAPSRAVIYPVFLGILENSGPRSLTDNVLSMGMRFQEVFVG
jgi:hypothetical protein